MSRSTLFGGLGAMFAVSFALALFVPIYEDEISWLILKSRYFLDGGVDITLWQNCLARRAVDPPWFLLPFRALDGWLAGPLLDPILIRLSGLLTYATWLGLGVALLPRVAGPTWNRLTVAGVGAAYLGLGLVPFVLAINRPEQQLLLVLVPLIAVALWPWDLPRQSTRRAVIVGLALIVATWFLAGHHTKGVLFGPLAAVAAWFAIRPLAIRLATLGLQGVTGILFGLHYADALRCPGDPVGERATAYFSVPLRIIGDDPLRLLRLLSWRLQESVLYFERMMFYQGRIHLNWLPARATLGPLDALANAGFAGVLIGVALIAVVGLGRLAAEAWRARAVGPRFGVALSLSIGIVVTMATQNQKHFYDGGFLWVVIGLTALIAWRPLAATWARPLRRAALAGLAAAALVSQVALWTWFVPEAATRLAGNTYRPNGESFSAFDYGPAAAEIRATAALCRIPLDGTTRYLALDGATYGVVWPIWRPIPVNYILADYWPFAADDPIAYLRARGSDGLLAACSTLPDDLAARARRNGATCCLPAFGAN